MDGATTPVLCIPAVLTAIWLLWVLDGLSGPDAVLLTLLGATAIGFAIWLFKAASEGGWGRWVAFGLGALSLAFGVVAPVSVSATAITTSASQGNTTASDYGAPWSPDAVAALVEAQQGVFVDFTARWCVTCQVNKRTTLDTRIVRQAFAENNITFLVADWTSRDDTIGAELQRHGRAGVPLYLLYRPGEAEPVVLPQMLRPDLVINSVQTK